MQCPKCGSENVNINVVTDVKTVKQHHSVLWWICIGWLWVPFKWLFLTLPALIVKMFGGKKKVVSKQRTMACCQACGNTWEVK